MSVPRLSVQLWMQIPRHSSARSGCCYHWTKALGSLQMVGSTRNRHTHAIPSSFGTTIRSRRPTRQTRFQSTATRNSVQGDGVSMKDMDGVKANIDVVQGMRLTPARPPNSLPKLLKVYVSLSKAKLASLVLATTVSGMYMASTSTAITASSLASTPSTMLLACFGTAFCVASANTLNQIFEWPLDAQMTRTRGRVMVRHAISPVHAFTFGLGSGLLGTGMLYSVSPVAAFLGFSNIILYAGIYTPSKRITIYNTHIGAIVGAIPPVIGWSAVTGTCLAMSDLGGWFIGSILFLWQFPHFNALSWRLREDYTRGGYRMMSVLDPKKCTRSSLWYSFLLIPVCSLAIPFTNLTTPWFAITSLLPNLILLRDAMSFHKGPTEKNARKLFMTSLWHLPLLLALLAVHKSTDVTDTWKRFIVRRVEGLEKWCVYEWMEEAIGWLLFGESKENVHDVVKEDSTSSSNEDAGVSSGLMGAKEDDAIPVLVKEQEKDTWTTCIYKWVKVKADSLVGS